MTNKELNIHGVDFSEVIQASGELAKIKHDKYMECLRKEYEIKEQYKNYNNKPENAINKFISENGKAFSFIKHGGDFENWLVNYEFITSLQKEISSIIKICLFEILEIENLESEFAKNKYMEHYYNSIFVEIYQQIDKKEKPIDYLDSKIDILVKSMIYSNLAYLAQSKENYYNALNFSRKSIEFETLFKFHKGYDFDEIIYEFSKSAGKKGGLKKGKKFAKPKQLALDYHDKYFASKDENGEFIYTAPKAAEKIILELLQQGHKEINNYAVSSLANIIREYRK